MPSETFKPLKVLYALHPTLDALDFTGPLEILFHATWTPTLSSPEGPSRVFAHTITAVDPQTTSNQTLAFQRHIPMEEAHSTLSSYDVLVIPGGGSPGVLEGQTEPLKLIKAFAALPKKEDGSVRTLMSVCTGSLFLAETGVLDGLKATTHPRFYEKLNEVSERKGRTIVLKERCSMRGEMASYSNCMYVVWILDYSMIWPSYTSRL